jgi:hypothetical protein
MCCLEMCHIRRVLVYEAKPQALELSHMPTNGAHPRVAPVPIENTVHVVMTEVTDVLR